MARTDASRVKEVISTKIAKLSPFIDSAHLLVNTHLAASYTTSADDAALLLAIETYVAAHLVAVRQGTRVREVVGPLTEAKDYGKLGTYLSSSSWGQTAITLDKSGRLAAWDAQIRQGGALFDTHAVATYEA